MREDVNHVDVDKIELPESMQQQPDERTLDSKNNENKTTENATMSLEQLAGLCIVGYNVVSCAIYRRFEPGFDASLTQDEMTAIQEPLKLVLKQYDVEVNPMTALCIALIGVNVCKIMQLQQYRQMKMQELQQQEAAEQTIQ